MKLKLGALSALILLAGCWEATDDQPETVTSASPVQESSKNPYESAGSNHPYVKTSLTGSEKDRLTSTFYFDFDSAKIDEVNQKLLKSVAAYLKDNPSETLSVVGHADTKGSFKYNQSLGFRRANAVAEYLESLGVSKEQVEISSKGKEEPIANDSNEAAQAINRRVVLDFSDE